MGSGACMDAQQFGKLDPDPHQSGKLDLDPDPHSHQNGKQDPDLHQRAKEEVLEGPFCSIGGPNLENS